MIELTHGKNIPPAVERTTCMSVWKVTNRLMLETGWRSSLLQICMFTSHKQLTAEVHIMFDHFKRWGFCACVHCLLPWGLHWSVLLSESTLPVLWASRRSTDSCVCALFDGSSLWGRVGVLELGSRDSSAHPHFWDFHLRFVGVLGFRYRLELQFID